MGIIGWIDIARDLREHQPTLHAMAAALGPATDALTQLSRHAALARRGPVTSYADWRHGGRPDFDLMLLIDGHLTNRIRLEEQLYQRASDAEVLLHAYRQWGAGLADRIDGTYTIAIWDNLARQLLLIRDPLSTRTLYWYRQPNGLLFASTATALLAHPQAPAVVDAGGLNEWLTLGPARTPGHGVIRDVRELLPGQLLRATPAGIRLHRYGQLQADQHGQDLDGTVHQLRQAIADKTTILRKRPAGAVLLSGIASAAAAAITNKPSPDRPSACSLTLTEPGSQPHGVGADITAAARTAAHLNMPYTIIAAGADRLLDAAAQAREALDFPGPANLDAPLTALLRHAAHRGHTSIVSGIGADAVFGGYRWLHGPEALAHDEFPWLPSGLTATDLLTDDVRWHLIPGAYRKMRFERHRRRQPPRRRRCHRPPAPHHAPPDANHLPAATAGPPRPARVDSRRHRAHPLRGLADRADAVQHAVADAAPARHPQRPAAPHDRRLAPARGDLAATALVPRRTSAAHVGEHPT
ncbi:asparagine synthase-related protein [Actinoplanes oblitus]|uniref:asparagine synthase (glutamine-hydrolyzing) n=1 Tax=Actinoplanes oblitus TaxID=3040509 RepID=A0ABY8WQ01_9ACTN|nr:asparagine synthase-related protein [Actinoplanes oblitus]WIM99979.1 asparagine synthase-related protein [Actinoplanes oblitus]